MGTFTNRCILEYAGCSLRIRTCVSCMCCGERHMWFSYSGAMIQKEDIFSCEGMSVYGICPDRRARRGREMEFVVDERFHSRAIPGRLPLVTGVRCFGWLWCVPGEPLAWEPPPDKKEGDGRVGVRFV